jgi:phosphoribosylformylglycinamidine cyclo-ligase
LQIHRSYLPVINDLKKMDGVHAFSHITGGGIIGNTKRVLPEGYKLVIDWNSWDRPAIFNLIQETGNVPEPDMREAFNLGIGLICIASSNALNSITKWAESKNEIIYQIGHVE